MNTIIPLILCGGSGSRLWPVSRKAFPKQFSTLVGGQSLFVSTVQRMQALGLASPLILTGDDYRFLACDQLSEASLDASPIIVEPMARGTAPAILAAALLAAKQDQTALLLVAPSDHLIEDIARFGDALAKGKKAAEAGAIVTFGIAPQHPETGYGYLQLAYQSYEGAAVPVINFIEKPDFERAVSMVADGGHLWNAGIFLFRANALVEAFRRYAPHFLVPVAAAVEQSAKDRSFLHLAEEPWAQVEFTSIDYAIMEKADNLVAVPFDGHWSDLGDWDAVWREREPQHRGVVAEGAATAVDCANTYLRSHTSSVEVVGIGLSDTLVVATGDAVLVADKARAQDVRLAVDQLHAKQARQADSFASDHRPWGWYETLARADGFQVKRIVVNPGAKLSLQSHEHRCEHWVVVAGTALVTLDEAQQRVLQNQSIFIPVGAKHRVENPGTEALVLIEVQTGSYLGEDDITRYEDVYART